MEEIFVDENENFYRVNGNTLIATDAIPGAFHKAHGELITISGCPVFRIANEEGQYTGHVLSVTAVKKLRRKTEERLRTGNYSLTMRTAAACGVSIV